MSKDFVLDHGGVIPDVYMFDGNCRDLVYDVGMKTFPESGANVLYLSYEYPPESIRDGRVDTNKVELDRPLR